MPLEAAFYVRSSSIFSSMRSRFKEKRNRKGRLIRVGREIPFNLEQFRAWMSEKLGGHEGAIQCCYCGEFITAFDLRIDHTIPVSRGGSLELENLSIVCDQSNR